MKTQYLKIKIPLKSGITILGLILILITSSCFNLDEEVYSEVLEETFTATEEDVVALMASGYTPLRYIMGWQGLFDVQEEPGDVIITPTRPNGWDDGGTYKRMHFHTWDNEQWQPRNTWLTAYEAINNINRVMLQLEEGSLPVTDEQVLAFSSELRALRALWYSILCDTHGNIPLVITYSDDVPEQSTRSEVYNFIIDELTEVIPNLTETVDKSTYGRITQWGAYQLLARMYLNAEVYNGAAEWEKCIEACNKIIGSGNYTLESDYKDVFKVDNEDSKEIVFAIPFDNIYGTGWNAHMKMLLPDHRFVFNMTAQPWGGSSANPQFINSYNPDDKRFDATWLHGDQISAIDGSVVLTLVNKMPSIYGCEFEEGFRVGKYEIEEGCQYYMSNDLPYFRYADVLMMKAECLLRTGKSDEAATLVTEIRERSFDDPAEAAVTGAELEGNTTIQYGTLAEDGSIDDPGDQTPVQYGRFLDELGWEFAAEFRRRTDMIRFGVYQTKSWYNHTPKGEYTALFPIGLEELNTNPNLVQNPGYE
ncbi:RagB/SusD family nutrient uptake outer membrane protein [Maribellus comscasis]|uniref:RagB/SusD family nutrient uptake outer membrane protein n=1 Tax=Maribellus comscasis TaxID=2681766 RepID=A0A6I6JQZ3_9BACT|nr:RagB/SusD family nutrient uptake outer membrane protein [Maribellus comscasis]QGY44801.1 RagB/SusD family nutrient uptake outer membrane protein [Maribellus comscasis]